jgi:hypothetical protein
MAGIGILIVLPAFALFGLCIWGLFNHGRSILCAMAGFMICLSAGGCGMYAWKESKSPTWTAIYVVIALIGTVAALRQALNGPQDDDISEDHKQSNSEN